MMENLKIIITSLFLLLPLTLNTHGASSEPLSPPEQKIIRINHPYSVEDTMKSELQKYEGSLVQTSFQTARGGLSAKLVILSGRYVARLSLSPSHVLEANQFDTLARTAQLEQITFENIGFSVYLPFSILLLADETDTSGNKTVGSIVIMPRAKGYPLAEYLSSVMPHDAKGKMVFDLGKSLASLQRAFMQEIEGGYYTASHGDFHEGNIFTFPSRDPCRLSTNWTFGLIDCASLELKGMHPLMDPLYFIYRANYALFSRGVAPNSLYDLTRSFYGGYLGSLPLNINRALYTILPSWRRIASTELTRTKGFLFFNEMLPNANTFLSLFDSLNTSAAGSVFKDIGCVPRGPVRLPAPPQPAAVPSRPEGVAGPLPAPAAPVGGGVAPSPALPAPTAQATPIGPTPQRPECPPDVPSPSVVFPVLVAPITPMRGAILQKPGCPQGILPKPAANLCQRANPMRRRLVAPVPPVRIISIRQISEKVIREISERVIEQISEKVRRQISEKVIHHLGVAPTPLVKQVDKRDPKDGGRRNSIVGALGKPLR